MAHKPLCHVFTDDPNISIPNLIAALSVIPLEQHGITRNRISPCTCKIISNLQQAGYLAFVVGGAVRDLLLGLEPKDYDVATNATPEEVRILFRRSRIIGRRFRLVHVMCGTETVEVSTFRGNLPVDKKNTIKEDADEHGRLLSDNIFGSQEEDAMRRDFTVNALFYNPASEEILDYLNGFNDIKARQLRIIGDPLQRYREDPVRMLRAVRFVVTLDIKMDADTVAPICNLAPLLQNVPSSRLFDEILKLLLSGHALTCMLDLYAHGLHHDLLPTLDLLMQQTSGGHFITLVLKNTDDRVKQNKSVSPGFLFAALLWHEVLKIWNSRQTMGEKSIPALHKAMSDVLIAQNKKLTIPRRYNAIMQEIWVMQPRFLLRKGRRPFRLIEHPRFRAAYDFMLLRCESGEIDKSLSQWWETFLNANFKEQETMLLEDIGTKKQRKIVSTVK
ncbi:MAG: polynucleotide adenylyltransferase PcnB [Nitrosomonadaceae bacterium]|nr:polynucleotide adenylyltransferase PcnB [Nitrosomonadaceae bacterium]